MVPCTTRGSFRLCSRRRNFGDFLVVAEDAHGREVGELQLDASTLNGSPILRVTAIDVIPSMQRSGVGTALYEEALSLSCGVGSRLVSDFARSPYAEAFWRKQAKKKRATCIRKNPNGAYSTNYFGGAIEVKAAAFEEECYALHRDYVRADACIRARLRGLLRGLPRPSRGNGGFYWPCAAYGIRRDVCKEGGSLKGLWGYP